MNFLKFSRKIVCTTRFQNFQQNVRSLFTAESLGLTTYQSNRRDALNNVESANRFKWELEAYVVRHESDPDSIKLKRSLELLLHFVQAEDVNLIKRTLYALSSVEYEPDKSKRSTGNLVMQSIYSIDMPELALELYNDPKLDGFFGSFKCTLLCLDLLYKNGHFDKMIGIDLEKRDQLWKKKNNFSKFIDILIFAACYKLNTDKSLDYAQRLWSDVKQTTQFKRSIAYVAALALNQGKPNSAIQMLQNFEQYFVTEQIKLLALADLGYIYDVNDALLTWTTHEKLTMNKISQDVLEKVKKRVTGNSANHQFLEICNGLIAKDRVSRETLGELLDRPISSRVSFRGKRADSDII